jgi:FkbM family methyltransferase
MVKLPELEDGPFKKAKDANNLHEWGLGDWLIVEPKLKNKRLAIDVGAHVGLTSIRYAKHFKNVLAFEPIYHDYLLENTAEHYNITTYDCALGDSEKNVEIQVSDQNSGANTVLDNSTKLATNWRKPGTFSIVKVKQMPLDHFLTNTPVDFIKIDTEGYNISVLKGADKTITRDHPLIQIEKSRSAEENHKVKVWLEERGYEMWKETNNKPQDQFWIKND